MRAFITFIGIGRLKCEKVQHTQLHYHELPQPPPSFAAIGSGDC